MTETLLYYIVALSFAVIGAAIFAVLFFIPAPYGRHLTGRFGVSMNNRFGWLMMEAPASILFVVFFLAGNSRIGVVPVVFLFIWQLHYFYRGFIYPWTLRPRSMPLAVAFMGFFFNVANTYLQGRWFATVGPVYQLSWLWDVRFIIGLILFLTGYSLNKWADAVLRRLMAKDPKKYQIPRGGLYEFISSPNYFAEIIEWIGWAVMTWSIPGAIFVFWTAANLIPRAWSHHRWYKDTFRNYPKQRKAIIPFIL